MTKPIPVDAMEPEFLTEVRDRFVSHEPTAVRLKIAAVNIDLAPGYLKQALAMSGKPLRELLVNMFDYEPKELEEPEEPEEGEEPEPDYRVQAAQLFLHGVEAGHWTATAREIEQARAPIIVKYGTEAFDMLAPEKIKDDLAREAGLPVKSFIYRKPTHLLQPTAPVLSGDDRERYLTVQRMQSNCAATLNSDASDRDKLRAIQHLLASVELVRPDIQAMWRVQFVQLLAVLRQLAQRYWQRIAEAESK